MATLQTIRSKGPLLVIVIGLALLRSSQVMLGKYSSRIRENKTPEK